MHQIAHLPWWAQLLIGSGLLVASAASERINRHLDTDALEIATVLLGGGGLVVLILWL